MSEGAVPPSPTSSSASRSHRSISDDGVTEVADIVQARRLTTTRSTGALTARSNSDTRGGSDGPGDISFSAVMPMTTSIPVPPLPAVARTLRVLGTRIGTTTATTSNNMDSDGDGPSQHAVYPQDHAQSHSTGVLSSPASIHSSSAVASPRFDGRSSARLASSSSALSSPFHARSEHDGPRRSASAMTSPVFSLSPNPNSGSPSAPMGFETLRGTPQIISSRSSAARRQDATTGGSSQGDKGATGMEEGASGTPVERMKRSASLSSRVRREPRDSERAERSERTAGKTSSASTVTPAATSMTKSSSSAALLGPSTSRSASSSNSGASGSTALPVKELKQPLLPTADLVSSSRPWSIFTPYWSKATVWGKLPNRPMRAHTATLVHDEESDSGEASIWVFGGCDAKTCFRDAWKLDLDTYQWSKPKLRGAHPPSLRAHSATYIPPFASQAPASSAGTSTTDGHIILFGGGDGPSYFNDLYLLNLRQNAWSKPPLFGEIPSARRAHTAVWYEPKKWLVVFGGGNGSRALNDTHVLECKKWDRLNWRKVETKGRKPRLRGYHTMNLVGDKAIIFGGSDGVECFSDVFILDLTTFRWSEILVYSPSLHCPRLSHSATLLSPTRLLILGGHDGSDYASTLVIFNLGSGKFEAVPHAGVSPSKRGYHSATAHDGRVTLIGGFDGKQHFDDTWTLDIGAWSDLAV